MTGIDRHGADVTNELFDVQCKLRAGQPSYLKEWLRGIVASATARQRIGIVIWKEPGRGKNDEDALVILRLKDWIELHGEAGER